MPRNSIKPFKDSLHSPTSSSQVLLDTKNLDEYIDYYTTLTDTDNIPYEINTNYSAIRPEQNRSFKFREILPEELENAMKSFPVRSAPGPDGDPISLIVNRLHIAWAFLVWV